MSLRLKWFKATGLNRTSLDQLLAGLVKDEYSEGRRSGFSNIALRGTFIEGQYIERSESITRIEDPFGKTLAYPIVQYERFSFVTGIRFPHIELHDPSRSLGAFFNQLAAYLNFSLGIESVNVDLLKWMNAIEGIVDSVYVTGALVSNLPLSNSVNAKIAVMGTSEVRPFVGKITG